MTTAIIKNCVIAEMEKLPYDLQLRILDFVKSLIPKGVNGKSLLRFKGTISDDDLRLMSLAIEENCERVDTSEW